MAAAIGNESESAGRRAARRGVGAAWPVCPARGSAGLGTTHPHLPMQTRGEFVLTWGKPCACRFGPIQTTHSTQYVATKSDTTDALLATPAAPIFGNFFQTTL